MSQLAEHIERKIIEDKYSPDAVIGQIKAKKLKFKTTICTKTLYNYIDHGIFLNITNMDLPVKKDRHKRPYSKVRTSQTPQLLGQRKSSVAHIPTASTTNIFVSF